MSGLGDFIGRVVNPQNPIGQFGQALLASGGDLSGAMGLMMQINGKREEHAGQFADWKQQYDYERANPKSSVAGPHYWESNDGSLHAVGPDGKSNEVYHDPTPKMNFIPDGMGGGQWLAVPTNGPMPTPGAMAPSTPKAPALGAVMADPRKMGGGSGNATGGFLGL